MPRKTKYLPEMCVQAEKLCKLGAKDVEIADFFGVSESNLNVWKQKHPEFAAALKAGKEVADEIVEQSLFQRAKGFQHPDVHISNFQGQVIETPITKHYPPDPTSCIFWLKNRRPDRWRETKAIELTGAKGGPVQTMTANMSPEQAAAAYKQVMGGVLESTG